MASKVRHQVPEQSNKETDRRTVVPVDSQAKDEQVTTVQEEYVKGNIGLDAMFENADEIESAILDLDIFKDAKLDALRGIPFAIVGGTFRERFSEGQMSDFVTLTCHIPTIAMLEKRHVRYTGTELWFPEQMFGINDGSTGIRRQIVAHLHNAGYIKAVEDGTVVVESGERGTCTWDRRVSEWDARDKGITSSKTDKTTGIEQMVWEFQLEKALVVPRGIRVSEYKNKRGGTTTTRYLG